MATGNLKRNLFALLFGFFAAPAVDETLCPDDAGNIVEEILEAQNHSSFLGLRLGLPLHVVEAIHSRYQDPKDRLLHVIIEFLKQAEPRPTWRVIVDALRSPLVNVTSLAKRVETVHFPDPNTTCEVLPETTYIGKTMLSLPYFKCL